MNKTDKGLIKKGDVGILLIALILTGVLWLYTGKREEGQFVYVTARGETTIYPLSKDSVISLTEGMESSNTIVIENGTVFMENANCLDQICVHHKAVSKDGETIICLPNQVFIAIESDSQSETDN